MLVRPTAAHGYHSERLDDIVDYLLDQQLDDGGWNCATRIERGKHSSFHTSIQALEALDAYQRSHGGVVTEAAQVRGREFFLGHHLYQSHHTGEVAIRNSTRFRSCLTGTSTYCEGSSTSSTWPQNMTSGSRTPLLSCGMRVERTAVGRRTPDIEAVPGFGWRNRVRVGGTPCERFGF
jgi:hypothetical protein